MSPFRGPKRVAWSVILFMLLAPVEAFSDWRQQCLPGYRLQGSRNDVTCVPDAPARGAEAAGRAARPGARKLCYRYPNAFRGLNPPPTPPWLMRGNPYRSNYGDHTPSVEMIKQKAPDGIWWNWPDYQESWSWEVRRGWRPRGVGVGPCLMELNVGGPK